MTRKYVVANPIQSHFFGLSLNIHFTATKLHALATFAPILIRYYMFDDLLIYNIMISQELIIKLLRKTVKLAKTMKVEAPQQLLDFCMYAVGTMGGIVAVS